MNLTVLDLFCGSGGFSEGFRKAGYKVIMGIDKWKPAIQTFQLNFPKSEALLKDIESLSDNEIKYLLPNTDILIGSPPCQSFSTSNKLGKSNKSYGISLIKVFLKIVVIKKEENNLKAWIMENVPNFLNHLKKEYTYSELGLSSFAKSKKIHQKKIAITLSQEKIKVISAVNFGVSQKRNRAFIGEVFKTKKFPNLNKFLNEKEVNLNKLFKNIPHPVNYKENNKYVKDPNYKEVTIKESEITDHFYDSGVYETKWKDCMLKKTKHPFMGKVQFPENFNKPSRTITATNGHSRETLLYKSEIKRKGNGEYREPTIRELALIMSFPISYQFEGSSNQKRRLIGNAVCPLVSYKISLSILKELNLKIKNNYKANSYKETSTNLNTYKIKTFNNPPTRRNNAKFRRTIFKKDGVSINFSNFDIANSSKVNGKWFLNVFLGYDIKRPIFINYNRFNEIEVFIIKETNGLQFINSLINLCKSKIINGKILQNSYEKPLKENRNSEPHNLIDKLEQLILKYSNMTKYHDCKKLEFLIKQKILETQLYAIYSLFIIEKIANNAISVKYTTNRKITESSQKGYFKNQELSSPVQHQ